MIKIKKFWEENKNEIIVGALIGVSAAAAYLLTKRYYDKNFYAIPITRNAISWNPTNDFITLEEVKEILDTVVDKEESIAIVKDRSQYMAIRLKEATR